MAHEAQVLLELTEDEVKQVLGTAVKQMCRLAQEPASETEFETLASVISKCSKATKSIDSKSSIRPPYPVALVKS
ncbi:MAG: hypothetical protein KGI25_09090 [Thaumarchaeota archaeon]|nr:hypothetical protein [Nitrososphaerota archaeon]